MHRICHKNSILVSTRNTGTGTMRKWPTQVSTVVANVGRELSLLKMAINMANADYPSFFLWNELEPRCQQRAAGSLELLASLSCMCDRPRARTPKHDVEIAQHCRQGTQYCAMSKLPPKIRFELIVSKINIQVDLSIMQPLINGIGFISYQ